MEDPGIQEYLQSLKSQKLKATLGIFLPYYEKAATQQEKDEILRMANLFLKTGHTELVEELIRNLVKDDESAMELVTSLVDIPNKFVRQKWLLRIANLVNETSDRGINLSELLTEFDFLQETAPYLILPLYEITKAYDNGNAIKYLSNLLSEIAYTYKDNPQQMRLHFQQAVQWFITVEHDLGRGDARDSFKEILENYGSLLNDQKIPLAERWEAMGLMTRLVRFPDTKDIMLANTKADDFSSLQKALKMAMVKAVERYFDMKETQAENLVRTFAGTMTALEMSWSLSFDRNYDHEMEQLKEIMAHIAVGDFESWRNMQKGQRLKGRVVNFLKNKPGFWDVFNRPDEVQIDTHAQSNITAKQLHKIVDDIHSTMDEQGESIIAQVDGEWFGRNFKLWKDNRTGFNDRRKGLSQIRILIKNSGPESLNEEHLRILQQEGITQISQDIDQKIQSRLKDYDQLRIWLNLYQWIDQMSKSQFDMKKLPELKLLMSTLIGRLENKDMVGLADFLTVFLEQVESIGEQVKYGKVIIQFTSAADLMIARGMLQPDLVDCFNVYGQPKNIAPLVDDLGSRNKILAIVREGNSQGRILSRAVVKVKQTQGGEPVIFPERPLYLKGGYGFEDEILEGLKRTKLPELKKFNALLAREGKVKDKRIKLFDTGGYSEKEYFEPLFGVRKRTEDGVVYHAGVIVADQAMKSQQRKAEFPFIGSIGYEKISQAKFLGILKAENIQVLVDVREFAYSQRPEYTKGNLQTALQAQGIAYVHYKELGAPKAIRANHELGKNDAEFLRAYEEYLKISPQAREALEKIINTLKGKRICLFCYEASTSQCHRLVILKHLKQEVRINEPIIDLRAPLLPLDLDDHPNQAMAVHGGIDLSSVKTPLEIQHAGVAIKFHLTPDVLKQLQNAPGFVPVIINIEPMVNIRQWLGLNDHQAAAQMF
jgi:hypothetical protein